MLDWSLVDGGLPLALSAVGGLAGGWLLLRRNRDWWRRVVPAVVLIAGAVLLTLLWVVDDLWQPFPDRLPLRVVGWIGVALGALGLAAAGFAGTGWWRRAGVVLAALLVITTAGMKINAFYGAYPTVRAALGLPPEGQIALADLPAAVPRPVVPVPGKSWLATWTPTGNLPATGGIVDVPISPARSRFAVTRDAYLYVPPAYWAPHRPLLPVLVLLHGQPGAPRDWLAGGGLAGLLNQFAAHHHGLAPVVVLPDTTGSEFGNPLCLDSRLGNAETYLTEDVPHWIRDHLQVDPAHWAVAGLSYGGTCALQLALRRPALFPSFVDISGQSEPTLGNRAQTVAAAFGGDQARFRAVNPADELAHIRFPDSAGVFTVGRDDSEYGPQQRTIFATAHRCGLPASLILVDGAHTWSAWSAGLAGALPWLAGRMGLTG